MRGDFDSFFTSWLGRKRKFLAFIEWDFQDTTLHVLWLPLRRACIYGALDTLANLIGMYLGYEQVPLQAHLNRLFSLRLLHVMRFFTLAQTTTTTNRLRRDISMTFREIVEWNLSFLMYSTHTHTLFWLRQLFNPILFV